MISIRTGVVLAAFVAMGLTQAAEHLAADRVATERLADRAEEAAGPARIGADEALPGKGLRLTQRLPAAPAEPDLSPWI